MMKIEKFAEASGAIALLFTTAVKELEEAQQRIEELEVRAKAAEYNFGVQVDHTNSLEKTRGHNMNIYMIKALGVKDCYFVSAVTAEDALTVLRVNHGKKDVEHIEAVSARELVEDERSNPGLNMHSKLLQTNDAMVWAEEFVKTKKRKGWSANDIDEGLMLCWFANAMAAQEFKEAKTNSAV
jgi:hypothetical protein